MADLRTTEKAKGGSHPQKAVKRKLRVETEDHFYSLQQVLSLWRPSLETKRRGKPTTLKPKAACRVLTCYCFGDQEETNHAKTKSSSQGPHLSKLTPAGRFKPCGQGKGVPGAAAAAPPQPSPPPAAHSAGLPAPSMLSGREPLQRYTTSSWKAAPKHTCEHSRWCGVFRDWSSFTWGGERWMLKRTQQKGFGQKHQRTRTFHK